MYIYYALASAFAVSAVSAVGMLVLFSKDEVCGKKVHTFLALAVGAMLGNALLHLLPHALTLETEALNSKNPPAIVQMISGEHDHHEEAQAPKNFAPHLDEYIKKHSTHDDHAGHDHDAHKGHDHDAHKGHDDHAGHDHDAHKDHDDHAGHDHASHAGHDDHAGHGHTGLFTALMLMFGMGLFGAFDLMLKRANHGHKNAVASEGYMVIGADIVENLLDGIVIGTAYMLSPAAGVAATITIFLHEIPLEIGDFAVMRHSGFSQRKALFFNLLSGLFSVVGVVIAVILGMTLEGFALFATPIAAGGFLYIASSIIIPKLRSQPEGAALYMLMSTLGVAAMIAILFFE